LNPVHFLVFRDCSKFCFRSFFFLHEFSFFVVHQFSSDRRSDRFFFFVITIVGRIAAVSPPLPRMTRSRTALAPSPVRHQPFSPPFATISLIFREARTSSRACEFRDIILFPLCFLFPPNPLCRGVAQTLFSEPIPFLRQIPFFERSVKIFPLSPPKRQGLAPSGPSAFLILGSDVKGSSLVGGGNVPRAPPSPGLGGVGGFFFFLGCRFSFPPPFPRTFFCQAFPADTPSNSPRMFPQLNTQSPLAW